MRVLFVHQNFPGQFLHLAQALRQRGHEVLALTSSENARKSTIPTVRYRYEADPGAFAGLGLARDFAAKTHRAEAVAKAAWALRERERLLPDVVFGHPGWGETLYLRDVWPAAQHLAYAEFFYRPRGLDVDFDPEFQRPGLRQDIWVRSRQAPMLLALSLADRALAPTAWQAATFPEELRARISVIHDGIDTRLVAPGQVRRLVLPGVEKPVEPGEELLTFVNRNLEPYRGYHIFMRALPRILQERPQARVVIVGGDGVSYGHRAPEGKTWRQVFADEVSREIDWSRVHFTGQVPYGTYLDLMRMTRVHAYLSYPFVLSWSLLEAMSAGALVVGSRTPPVEEVIADGVNGRLVDFFDVEAWVSTLIECLARPDLFLPMRAAARQLVVTKYDLASCCLPRLVDFVERG